MPLGGRLAWQLRAKAGHCLILLPGCFPYRYPCEQTAACSNTNANANAVLSCRLACPTSTGPWQAVPAEAFHACPCSCDALEGPRAWGRVQDGAVQGQSWSFSRGINVCLQLSSHRDGPGALQRGTQGWSPPRSMAAALAAPVSAGPPLLPGTSHCTRSQTQHEPASSAVSGACCFLHPAPKRRQLCFFTGAAGGPPPRLYSPQLSCRPPRDHPPQADARLGRAQLQPACSPGCCRRWHSPIAAEAASWDVSWPRVRVSRLAIAKGFAGTSLTSPGGCCNSGAGVRRLQRDAGSAPPTVACCQFCSRSL